MNNKPYDSQMGSKFAQATYMLETKEGCNMWPRTVTLCPGHCVRNTYVAQMIGHSVTN